MKRSKWLGIMLSFLLTFSLAPVQAFAIGTGTESDPIQITSEDELKAISGSNHYILMNDIALAADWTPISTFSGTLDGDEHTIRGLNVSNSNTYCGLVGQLETGGVIKNLTIYGQVTSTSTSYTRTGGFAGNNDGTITNCEFHGSVSQRQGDNMALGGIAGINQGAITNCRNYGDITGISTGGSYNAVFVGGMTGSNHGTVEISDCVNEGDLFASAKNANTYVGEIWGSKTWKSNGAYVGGIAGDNDGSDAPGCVNNGLIMGENSSVDTNLISITGPEAIELDAPVAADALTSMLPSTVELETSQGKRIGAVQWDTSTYNASQSGTQYDFSGAVTLPEKIKNPNAVELKTGIHVIVNGSSTPAEHSHPVCADASCGQHGNALTYTAWDGTLTSLPEGNYYLTEDATPVSAVHVQGTVNLCLNGHTITGSGGSVFSVPSGATLNICDCSAAGTGEIQCTGTHGYGISNAGNLYIYGGKISSASHAGLYNDGALVQHGGEITGASYGMQNNGTATVQGKVTATGPSGTGIGVSTGKLFVQAGAQVWATGDESIGVNLENGGKMEMTGNAMISGESCGVDVLYGSTATICAGTIKTADLSHGIGVYVNGFGSQVVVTGSARVEAPRGLDIVSYGQATVSGGQIIAKADAYEETYGVFRSYDAQSLTVSGGSISATANNASAYGIFNESSNAQLTVSGGTIHAQTEGQNGKGYAVYVNAPTVISGGTLTASHYGAYVDSQFETGNITLSGNASVSGKTAGIYVPRENAITAKNGASLYTGGNITIDYPDGRLGDVVVKEVVAGTNDKKFSVINQGKSLKLDATNLVLALPSYTITLPPTQTGYTLTGDTTAVHGTDKAYVFTLDAANGYYTMPDFDIMVNGTSVLPLDDSNQFTIADITADKTITVTGVAKDDIAPTGEIRAAENSWHTFFGDITFEQFFQDAQSVTITATDVGSGVRAISYYLSDAEMSLDQVKTIADWRDYPGTFVIAPNRQYVIYAKITDSAGNVTYLNSNGMVLDDIRPAISGIEDAKTYCEAVEVSVDDAYMDAVTLNGETIPLVGGKFIISPAEVGQVIVVTDKAGNRAEMAVTVNDGHIFTDYRPNGDATCTHDGTKSAKCHFCDVVDTTADVDSMLQHAFGAWLDDLDGQNHRRLCTCGAFEREAHRWGDGEVIKEPTTTQKGVKIYTCTVCGAVRTEQVPTLSGLPQTGDHGEWMCWSLLLLLSSIGMASAALSRKKA